MCSCNTCNNGKGCNSKKNHKPFEFDECNIDWLGWDWIPDKPKNYIEIESYSPTTNESVKACIQTTSTNIPEIKELPDLVKLFIPNVKKVIFNNPATIVFWEDGSKTVVKCSEEFEDYDKEKGLAFCFLKKLYGDKYYQKILKPIVKKFDKEDMENTEIIKMQNKNQTKGGKNEKWVK